MQSRRQQEAPSGFPDLCRSVLSSFASDIPRVWTPRPGNSLKHQRWQGQHSPPIYFLGAHTCSGRAGIEGMEWKKEVKKIDPAYYNSFPILTTASFSSMSVSLVVK